MAVNVHERLIEAPIGKAGALIDRLASRDDVMWPKDRWPPVRFDRPLGVGARGGHGPVRYFVESYEPGRRVVFRFTAPRGFEGTHGFDVEEVASGAVRVRHVLSMRARGVARLTWPLAFRRLHDALIEDALDRAEAFLTSAPVAGREWSSRVKLLRRVAALAAARASGVNSKSKSSKSRARP